MDFIIDPDTQIQYSIFSKEGLKLLNSYLKSYKIGAKKTENCEWNFHAKTLRILSKIPSRK